MSSHVIFWVKKNEGKELLIILLDFIAIRALILVRSTIKQQRLLLLKVGFSPKMGVMASLVNPTHNFKTASSIEPCGLAWKNKQRLRFLFLFEVLLFFRIESQFWYKNEILALHILTLGRRKIFDFSQLPKFSLNNAWYRTKKSTE